MWQAWSEDNRLFFTQGFVGRQIDLKQYSKPYWQPMKGAKQWKTASKWKRLCHQTAPVDSVAPNAGRDTKLSVVSFDNTETSLKHGQMDMKTIR